MIVRFSFSTVYSAAYTFATKTFVLNNTEVDAQGNVTFFGQTFYSTLPGDADIRDTILGLIECP